MNSMNWKGIAEMFGITAIVASLIFVGLQMRQSQEIAIAETFLSILSSEIAINNSVNEHAELWAKANSGAELNEAETVIFANLVASLDSETHRSSAQLLRLGHTGAEELQKADFASFLHQNPAARHEWVSQWEIRKRHRALLHDHISPFPNDVLGNLEKLDEMQH